MELDSGTVVDRYTIEGRLGEGGMAVVYKARHAQLGTEHAIKVLTIPGKSIRQRLLQEGRVQALLRHPNIVSVTDVIDVEGQPGLVMEYIEGLSLEQLLEKLPLSIEQVDALARGIIEGVAEAHRQELIHRDLKPGNVMIQFGPRGPVPKVTDFGLAKVLSADEFSGTKTRSGMAMGTPCYMAPEQIRDAKTVDRRADIWALGCMLYEMITRRRAFDAADMFSIFSAVTAGQYVSVRDLAPDVPDRMVRAIDRCLNVDRELRLTDCENVLDVWCGRTDGDTPVPTPPNSIWGAELMALKPAPSTTKSLGTWSADVEVTRSSHESAKKPSKSRSADTLAGGGSKAPPRPVPAPTGVIAPPSAADRAEARARSVGGTSRPTPSMESPGNSTSKLLVGALVVGSLAIGGMGLLGLGVAGGVLATSSTPGTPEAPTATPSSPVQAPIVPVASPSTPTPPPVPDPATPTVATPSATTPTAPERPSIKVPKADRPTPKEAAPEVRPAVEAAPTSAKKGLLIVNSRPWSNISLDGGSAGRTGGWRREVSAGTHVVRLETADGQAIERKVDVKADGDNVFCWDFSLGSACPK